MIDTIEIIIKNGIIESTSLLLIYEKNICYLNNKKYAVDETFKEELLRIIRTWKNEYGSSSDIDSEEFLITITTKNTKETIHGKGNYPNNYNSLIELIGGINGRY